MKTLLVLFLVVAAAVAKPIFSFEDDDSDDRYFVRSIRTGTPYNAPSFRLGKSFSDVSVEEFDDDDDVVPVAVFSHAEPAPAVVSHAVASVPVVGHQKSIDVQTYSAPSAVPVVSYQTYSAVPQVYSGFSPAGSVAVHSPVVPQVYSGSSGSVAVHSPFESQAYSDLSSVGSVAVHAVPSFSVQPVSSVAVHAAAPVALHSVSPSLYSVPGVVSSAGVSNFVERPVSVMTYQQPAFRSAVYTAPHGYVVGHSFEDDRFDFD